MRYKFVRKEDMVDGTPTLGVVYHMVRERDIRNHFLAMGEEPPNVYGYILVEGEEGEDNENET